METSDRESAASRSDVIAAILEDHAEIESLMGRIADGDGAARSQKQELFRELVMLLAAHETAEEEIVHPLARRAADADQVVEARLQEESKGKKVLAHLEEIGVDSPEFDAEFATLRRDVLEHAQHEEEEEHPRLERAVSQDRLDQAGSAFRAAERVAPTHAHANAPESATGNILVGTFVAVADRVRDAIRSSGPSD